MHHHTQLVFQTVLADFLQRLTSNGDPPCLYLLGSWNYMGKEILFKRMKMFWTVVIVESYEYTKKVNCVLLKNKIL
jgi:hypothetical protein